MTRIPKFDSSKNAERKNMSNITNNGHTLILGTTADGMSSMWGSAGQKVLPVVNTAGVPLEEVCRDTETAMVCAGYMRVARFTDRQAFIESKWTPDHGGPVRATELDGFDVWVDNPQFQR